MKILLSSYLELVKEFHTTKNGNLSPNDFSYGSSKKVWWKCDQGNDHEWEAVVRSRTIRKDKCPFCSHKKASSTYNLLLKHPNITSEWNYEKNGELKPNHVTPSTTRKVWWKCSKGHDYEHSVNQKISKKIICPFCSGYRVGYYSNLEDYKSVCDQWHPSKNGDLKPTDFSRGSGKKVWWKCPKGDDHEWETKISARTRKEASGCPFCVGLKVSKDNNFAKLFPKTAKEWNFNKNKNILPKEFVPGSHVKVWWRCSLRPDHEWKATIHNRTSKLRPSGCPHCRKKKVNAYNNLKFKFPEIAKEWHPTKNGYETPDQVASASGMKVWWLCPKKHEYFATIGGRSQGNGCPKCSNQTSKAEIRVFSELQYLFKDAILRHKIKKIELDVFVPSLNLGIEYDGYFYHKVNEKRDLRKNDFIQRLGLKLIRIREKPLQKLSENDLIINHRKFLTKNDLNSIVRKLQKILSVDNIPFSKYLNHKTFLNEQNYKDIIYNLPFPLLKNSLLTTDPDLCKEWDYKKNYPSRPEHFTFGSGEEVFWECPKGHDYKMSIQKRTSSRKYNCPMCSGRRLSKDNSLQIKYPLIAKQWHPTKNGENQPGHFTHGSNVKVWWQCDKHKDHEWEAVIGERTGRNRGCPFCSGNKASLTNNLLTFFPEIAEQWHPIKNGNLRPEYFKKSSNKKVWWKCEKDRDHEWEATIDSRTSRNRGCPFCSGNKVSEKNSLEYLFPSIAKQWHPNKNSHLKPSQVSKGSNKRVWFICDFGHEYETKIQYRTGKGSRCPTCFQINHKKETKGNIYS